MKTGNFVFKSIFCLVLISIFSINAKAGTPKIVLLGNDTIHIEQGYTFTDPGYVIYDSANNIITNADAVTDNNKFSNLVVKTYIFKYNYTDAHNNKAAEVQRVVIVTPDQTPPDLEIDGPLLIQHTVFEPFTLPEILKAYDLVDGNLINSVSVSNNLNVNQLGLYSIVFTAEDMNQNKTQVTIIVNVVDNVAPVISFSGSLYDTIYVGEFYNKQISAVDNYDMVASLSTDTSGTFYQNYPDGIPTKTGNYTFNIKIEDVSGNYSEKTFYIHVRNPSLSGTINLQNNTSTSRKAIVYLIKFDAVDSTLSAVDTYMVASGNAFTFNNIKAGNYLVKAALDSTDSLYANYLPTYYYGELKWDKATTISLGQNTSIPINMLQGNNSGGPGFIAGKVSQGANKAEGDPIENIEILLTTLDDKPVAYIYSDENGYFEFKNMAYGEYKLFGEVAGLKSLGATLKLDEGNKTENRVEVRVNSTYVSTTINASVGLHEMDLNLNINIYPNPASNKIYIYNAGQKYLCNAKMYNTAGQLILNNNLSSVNSSVINVENLPNGIYILQLDVDNSTQRKMVLIQH